MKRFALVFAATALAILAAAPLAPAAGTSVKVTGTEFHFKLSRTSIPHPGTVTFSFHNAGHMDHDFRIGGKQTPLIGPGKTAKLTVTFHKKGRFGYLCTVPGHAAAGMKGDFTVR